MELSINEAGKLLKTMWPSRSYMVPCMVGKPGIGKTQSVYALRDWVREHTEFKDCKVVEIITSTILPSEVSGITMPDTESRSLDIFDHVKLSSLNDGDILFFDELLQGSEQTLKACLTLIMERRMLSGRMLPDIMIVAACNNRDIRMVEPSIRQRFTWIDVAYNRDDYYDFLYDHGVEYPQKLVDLVEYNVTEWNIMTPRTIYNIYRWYHDSNCSNSILPMITNIYGYAVSQAIQQAAEKNQDKENLESLKQVLATNSPLLTKDEINEAFNILNDKHTSAESIMSKLFELLQTTQQWDKIQEKLKEVEV